MRSLRRAAAILVLAVIPATALATDETSGAENTLPAPRLIGPRSGEERATIGRKNGANSLTEKAMREGLDWLARHEEPDGGWDADGFGARCAEVGDESAEPCDGIGKGQHGEPVPCPFDGSITALATLAFLGDGHLPGVADDPYTALVERNLELLRGASDAWSLPLATLCFAEAEAMQRTGRYRDAVNAGAAAILGRRQEDGAWGYAAPWRPGSDTPYSALCVQALAAARDAGAELPDDLGSGVQRWLATLEVDEKGRVAYLVNGRQYGYTPTTTNAHLTAAMRELLGVGLDSEAHRRSMALLATKRPAWKISFRTATVRGQELEVQVGHLSMYQWWYGTIATHQAGGATWSSWWGKLKGALVGHQVDSGCAAGSWDPVGEYERLTGGRVFATALGVLMLQEPYRHLRMPR